MNCARNCGNLLNFVKVIPKVLLVPFFSGHGVVYTGCPQKVTIEQVHVVYNISRICILQQLEKHWTARSVCHERRSQYWNVLIMSRYASG